MKTRKEYIWIIAIIGISALLLFQLILVKRLYQLDGNRFYENIEMVIKQGIPHLNINQGLIRSKDKNIVGYDSETNELTIIIKDKKHVFIIDADELSERELLERVYYDVSNIRWSASLLDSLVRDSLRGDYHSVPLKIVIRDSLGKVVDEAGNIAFVGKPCFGPVPLGYVTGRTLEAYYYFPFINFLYHESDRILMTAALFVLLVFFICFLIRTIRVERKMANSREEFMHIVVHNLQSPVDFVRRVSYEIKSRSPHPYNDTQEELYKELKGRLDMMGGGIRRLLTHSVGLYGMSLEKSGVELREMAERIVTQYRMLSGKPIELECDVPGIRLLADPVHLSEAVANLVENAVKYTGEDARIKVTCGVRGKYVCIVVADNGPGIPEKELGRVFRKYYRASNAQKGFGLGLNYVWKVVAAHNGKIEVRNKSGCEFTILLPWKKG